MGSHGGSSVIAQEGHAIDPVEFRLALRTWGRQHFRPLPWRLTRDPYQILMAEIMLHRTQASQVVPIYLRFIDRFPDVSSLAEAQPADLHHELYSLGLRWRIDLVRDMADALVERFGGQVPREREDLLSLPGVSEYIVGAVRCFTWNLPEPLIDTNTVRVTGRLFGLEVRDSSRRNRHFREVISALLDPEHPRDYNYALLDLADAICTARKDPTCYQCPVAEWCRYRSSGQPTLPSGPGQ